ncbi:MAG: polysaccharide biosynthesis/export family protein [Nitrospirae bacterium]|nr:polysaccharide biosynthesis/export family protein [Nitrospirota bacterium]
MPRVAFFFLVVMFLAGCGGSSAVRTSSPADIMASSKKSDKLNEALLISAITQQTPLEESYLIGPEDLLDIEAYNVEELKKTVRVNSQGDIALPLVGILNIKGLTTAEAEKLIAQRLEKYVQETVVTVFVREYKSQRISVIGAVKKSQVFAITGQRYLLDMLLMADGLAAEAGNICYVVRPTLRTNPNSKAETIVIDLDELIMRGNFSLNIPVFAGDIINVPKGGIFFVDGSVRTPGVYNLKGKTNLTQAISIAQGASPIADLTEVRIYRENGKGDRDIIIVDYNDIMSGSKSDIQIAENDIIIVPQSDMKNFFNGFINTIRGFVSFGTRAM